VNVRYDVVAAGVSGETSVADARSLGFADADLTFSEQTAGRNRKEERERTRDRIHVKPDIVQPEDKGRDTRRDTEFRRENGHGFSVY